MRLHVVHVGRGGAGIFQRQPNGFRQALAFRIQGQRAEGLRGRTKAQEFRQHARAAGSRMVLAFYHHAHRRLAEHNSVPVAVKRAHGFLGFVVAF